MRRTGSALTLATLLFAGVTGAAEIEFYQTVDRNEVGQSDPFNLTVVVSNAPEGSTVQFPQSNDFETLHRSESSQRSIEFINGRFAQKDSRKYVLTLRALKVGNVKIPPATLTVNGKAFKTAPITLVVHKGHLADPQASARQRAQDPLSAFGFPPDPVFQGSGPPINVDDEPDVAESDVNVPSNDSDLFLRSVVDKPTAYVGEQLTFSVYIYSRVDLSAVDQVNLPKLDGFWSEDIDSPDRLAPEAKLLNGIPYRVYLIKRKAIFPVHAGTLTLPAAEADVTTGFLFAGRRVHREGNPVTLKVKPLPPGAPAGFAAANVGHWKLDVEASPTQVELGSPINVRVTVEGEGNVRDLVLPRLSAPATLKVFDPTTNDKVQTQRFKVMGKRVQEYVVMPQRTGAFTLPALHLSYFNPQTGKYEQSHAAAITLSVSAGTGANASVAGKGGEGPKNVLIAGGIRPLRYAPSFAANDAPLWKRPFYLPLLAATPLAWVAVTALGLMRGRMSREDEGAAARRKLKAARGRLDTAVKLKSAGDSAAFHGEVERAVMSFIEAKLGTSVSGLTREALSEKMTAAAVRPPLQMRIRHLLDDCDMGRFAPGADEGARERLLTDAAAIMEGWGA